ncbi:MAG: glutamate--tRNA ligase, partial [Tannerella sp.]|nr:glutamate--tRNA ligase [Tannerella sp.]
FLALLGWNPGDDREVMTMQELIDSFDLSRCSRSGAKFDHEKGRWFNHRYIQKRDNRDIAAMFMPVLERHGVTAPDPAYVEKIVGMMKERVSFVPDLWAQTYYFFVAPETYDAKTRAKRWKDDSAAQLSELVDVLRRREPFDVEGTEEEVKAWMARKGYHPGHIMNAVRLALVGEGIGPQVFHITEAIGKEESIRRIRRAIEVLK